MRRPHLVGHEREVKARLRLVLETSVEHGRAQALPAERQRHPGALVPGDHIVRAHLVVAVCHAQQPLVEQDQRAFALRIAHAAHLLAHPRLQRLGVSEAPMRYRRAPRGTAARAS